jgi:hypothetical protein
MSTYGIRWLASMPGTEPGESGSRIRTATIGNREQREPRRLIGPELAISGSNSLGPLSQKRANFSGCRDSRAEPRRSSGGGGTRSRTLWSDNWVCSKFPAAEPAEALAAALREREFTNLGADPIVGPQRSRTVSSGGGVDPGCGSLARLCLSRSPPFSS